MRITMTGKEPLNGVANGEVDMLEATLALLRATGTDYSVIGVSR